MREETLDYLCCPACRAELTLDAEKRDEKEILAGTLTCAGCSKSYPIEDGIPNLVVS